MPSNAVAHYTTLFLRFEGKWLLLKRSAQKRLQPNRYTGLGGRVEPDELGNLRNSLLRELTEETALGESDVKNLTLRRMLTHNRPGEPLTVLFYFTATLKHYALPNCPEGTLSWVAPEDFAALDIIETTAHVLPELVKDVETKSELVRLGVAHYNAEGLAGVVWGD